MRKYFIIGLVLVASPFVLAVLSIAGALIYYGKDLPDAGSVLDLNIKECKLNQTQQAVKLETVPFKLGKAVEAAQQQPPSFMPSEVAREVARQQLISRFNNKVPSFDWHMAFAIQSFKVEWGLSDDVQMLMFLETAPFNPDGTNAACASQRYFNKQPDQLNWAEAALLAAMPKAPTIYDPVKYPDHAKERRNLILQDLGKLGFMTDDEVKSAIATPLLP